MAGSGAISGSLGNMDAPLGQREDEAVRQSGQEPHAVMLEECGSSIEAEDLPRRIDPL